MGTWRLLLAWLVIADHTPGLRMITGLSLGKIAVCAFFFVSGFLMPLTFNTHYRRYGTRLGSQKFYLNRIMRIYPLYWASLAVTLLAVAFIGPSLLEHAATITDLHRPRTYLQNVLLLGLNQTGVWGDDFRFNPPAWTLDVELQYYALVPFLVALTARWRGWSIGVLLAFAAASGYLFFRPTGAYAVDRSLLAWSFLFLLGYGFYFSPRLQSLALRWRWLVPGIMVLLLLAWVCRYPNLTTLLVVFACIGVSAPLLVLQQNRGFGKRDRLLGDLSYPTYILHWICVELLLRVLGSHVTPVISATRFAALFAVNVTLVTLVAYLSLRLIADPIELLRKRIRDGRTPRTAD
jgi:peptidoglycan/LPS O-acetylase OafA/YrhL